MARFEIEIPDHLVPGLNKVVGRYNAETGHDWDAGRWLREHVLELAMQDELNAEGARLTAQAQRDVQAGLEALRMRLAAEGVAA
jgi:hypothetical protein